MKTTSSGHCLNVYICCRTSFHALAGALLASTVIVLMVLRRGIGAKHVSSRGSTVFTARLAAQHMPAADAQQRQQAGIIAPHMANVDMAVPLAPPATRGKGETAHLTLQARHAEVGRQ